MLLSNVKLSDISDDVFPLYWQLALYPERETFSLCGYKSLQDRQAILLIACGPNIIDLNVSCTNLTDKFLNLLQSLNLKLISLNVSGCLKITPEAILRFTKATPTLKSVHLDDSHKGKWEQLKNNPL